MSQEYLIPPVIQGGQRLEVQVDAAPTFQRLWAQGRGAGPDGGWEKPCKSHRSPVSQNPGMGREEGLQHPAACPRAVTSEA